MVNNGMGNLNAVNTFFLSHDKYVANALVHFGDREDHRPAIAQGFVNRTIDSAWYLAIPDAEIRRLRDLYRGTGDTPKFRVDLLVLLEGPYWAFMEPPADRFELTFKNATFRVYQRRLDQPPP